MFNNAAIIGVGQSQYVRRPEPGQTTHTFIRDAVIAALLNMPPWLAEFRPEIL